MGVEKSLGEGKVVRWDEMIGVSRRPTCSLEHLPLYLIDSVRMRKDIRCLNCLVQDLINVECSDFQKRFENRGGLKVTGGHSVEIFETRAPHQ